ncbi:TMhelix containing protein [Vibrio phage 1.015.O._10N.222.51.E5]|nr:TMhelix containing protein [Vibrio phage 1.015.O._10N.222.51.E5]AUR95618.1 TMhelix containing protein [Vibrio phage 1.209.O._10N.222.52.B2]
MSRLIANLLPIAVIVILIVAILPVIHGMLASIIPTIFASIP